MPQSPGAQTSLIRRNTLAGSEKASGSLIIPHEGLDAEGFGNVPTKQRNTLHSPQALLTDFSALGKSAGTSWVTAPVAAHSHPRWKVVINPTQAME